VAKALCAFATASDKNTPMKYPYTLFFSFVLAVLAFAPTTPVHAATTASLLAQIQLLKAQLAALEQELLLRDTTSSTGLTDCFTVSGIRYCVRDSGLDTRDFSNADNIDTIEVDFVGDIAQVRVEFDDGDTNFYAIEADTLGDVARLLAPELRLSAATTLRLLDEVNSFDRNNGNGNDIDSIDVDFDGDDADVVVQFDDRDTDRFTLRNVDRDEDEVIERLADRYNEDENDIEDWIDFDNNGNNNNNIDTIDVDFFSDDVSVVVRFRNGNTDRFTLRNVDDNKDEIIERLADRYNEDEDDIEDVIDFN
jgi:hypothetical protein